jgi:predicted transcriptional regulator of viral defense system
MTTAIPSQQRLKSAGVGAIFRPRDLEPLGVSFPVLQRMVATGAVVKIGPGVYRLAEAEPTELETIAMVGSAIPNGIVCLLSALAVHGIGTQSPHQVWVALDRKSHKPQRLGKVVHIVRFSGRMLTYGVERHEILGVPVRVTSAARTIVDCFRYRNKIGVDVAIEALRDAVQTRKVTVGELARVADVCRARTVMRPYLEAIAS